MRVVESIGASIRRHAGWTRSGMSATPFMQRAAEYTERLFLYNEEQLPEASWAGLPEVARPQKDEERRKIGMWFQSFFFLRLSALPDSN
jgi:hypothetical protein